MPTNARHNRKRLMRGGIAFAAVVACAIYGATLLGARTDWAGARRPAASAQQLGSQADVAKHVRYERSTSAILLGSYSSAGWALPVGALHLPAAHTSLVIESDELLLAHRDSLVRIEFNGNPLLEFIPRASHAPEGPFHIVYGSSYGIISLPPNAETAGYRFELPARAVCERQICHVSIQVQHASWRVERIAIQTEDAIGEVGEFR